MEIKDCNVVTNASMIFNQIVKNTMKSYENTRKLLELKEMITQLGVYYNIITFKKYKLHAANLIERWALDADQQQYTN